MSRFHQVCWNRLKNCIKVGPAALLLRVHDDMKFGLLIPLRRRIATLLPFVATSRSKACLRLLS